MCKLRGACKFGDRRSDLGVYPCGEFVGFFFGGFLAVAQK